MRNDRVETTWDVTARADVRKRRTSSASHSAACRQILRAARQGTGIMDARTYVTYMLGVSHDRLREAVNGVSEADARRLLSGRLAPIVWQVGHIALVDGNYVRFAGGDSPVPARYVDLFKQGSGGEQDYPSLSDVRNVFDSTHRALTDRAGGANYQAPVDALSYKTVGEMFMYSGYHRGYHIGKIMTLRSLLGKAVVR
jgi:hypothetical protein